MAGNGHEYVQDGPERLYGKQSISIVFYFLWGTKKGKKGGGGGKIAGRRYKIEGFRLKGFRLTALGMIGLAEIEQGCDQVIQEHFGHTA
jgi:hypothetical protein